MAKSSDPRRRPLPGPNPHASPFAEASDTELRERVDDVLKSNRVDAATGEVIPPQDERFHSAGRTIVEAREASNAEDPWRDQGPKTAESASWFVSIEQRPVGPLRLKTMKEFWDDGTLDPEMLCWRAGFEEWIPVRKDRLLISVLGENSVLLKLKRGDTTGRWKPVAGGMLEKLRQDAIDSRVALPPIPAQPFDQVRLEGRPYAPPEPAVAQRAPRGPLLAVGVLSGLFSGAMVAAFFLVMRPMAPAEQSLPSDPVAVPAARVVVTVPPAGAAGVAGAGAAGNPAPTNGSGESPLAPVRAPVAGSAAQAGSGPGASAGSTAQASSGAATASARSQTKAHETKKSDGEAPAAVESEQPDFERTFTADLAREESAEVSSVPETLDSGEIMATLLEHKAAFNDCVSRLAPTDPEGPKSMVMRWTIEPSGATSDITAVTEELAGSLLESCLEKEIGKWKFPKHKTQGEPFQFPFALPHAD